MAIGKPGAAEVTVWVERWTATQGLGFGVTDAATVTAAVALLREGRRPQRVRGARPARSG